jgi:hypothetical protein
MPIHAIRVLEIAAGAAVVAGLSVAGAWMLLRKRPSSQELELARRQLLTQSGRLVDGTLLDVCEIPAEDGRTLTMLLYGYRIGGVDYECTQDVTEMQNVVDVGTVRAGFPCTVRYQPGNPQNSIVVSERWTGLRASIPLLPAYDRRQSLDRRPAS